jgi:glycosyltransferase involved in cell wall biosynthesis
MPRLIFDLTISACWFGPPVGIVRVEQQLARLAFEDASTTVEFSVFNPLVRGFGLLDKEIARAVFAGHARLVPAFPKIERSALAREVRQPRKRALRILEALQGTLSERGALRRLNDTLLKWLKQRDSIRPKYRLDEYGVRWYPFGDVVSEPLTLGPDDVLFSCDLNWMGEDNSAIYELKRQYGFRFVAFCHDVLPWKLPQYFGLSHQTTFIAQLVEASRRADKVLVLSERSRQDYAEFCGHFMIPAPSIAKISVPHWDAAEVEPSRGRIAELAGVPFVLFVSTIEPRKNHRLAYQVWERLVEMGEIPPDVQLVFAGRIGWQVSDLLHEIGENPTVRGRILIVEDASDGEIVWLYRNCLFTIFPSVYEGYGLPAIESLRHGKLCVAADRGALPEVLGHLGILLDPFDLPAWRRTLRDLINDRALLASRSAPIVEAGRAASADAGPSFVSVVMS